MSYTRKITAYILLPVAACLLLYVLEQILLVDYVTKTLAKLVLFLGIPAVVRLFLFPSDAGKSSGRATLQGLLPGLYLGLGVFGVVVGAYLLFSRYIDAVSIMSELNEKSGITTPRAYLLTGLYISLGNSFLEEFFFRGYIFLNLYRANLRRLAYLSSALLFSLYHLAIFNTWFSPFIMVLSLLGLMAAGLLLNFVVMKTKSMFSAWIIHICANIAIIGIGYTWL